MIDKVGLGVEFFDAKYGGIYRNRPVLCMGRMGSGKNILSYHFVSQGLRTGDKVLLLSNIMAKDVVILGESYTMPFSTAVQRGQLIILENAKLLNSDESTSSNVMLPPEAFMELQDIIESQSVARIVLDSVVPWLAIQPVARLTEHVYSFSHALERLRVTSFLTMPKPVSAAAFSLKKLMEDLCPVSITLDHENGANRSFIVSKYIGEMQGIAQTLPIDIVKGQGIVLRGEKPKSVASPYAFSAAVAPQTPGRESAPKEEVASASSAPSKKPDGPIRFSDALRGMK